MNDDALQSQWRNDEDRIMPEGKDDERYPSLSKNGEEETPLSKKQVNNRRLPNRSCSEVCTFKETDGVALLTTKELKGRH